VRLPHESPFVLQEDKSLLEDFNTRTGPDRQVHFDKTLPEPFVGPKDAPVVLLSNNPGVGRGAGIKKDPAFRDMMRANLEHRPLDYPFVYLAPSVAGPHRQWWVRKLKHLIN
jgi:hypothetical protein